MKKEKVVKSTKYISKRVTAVVKNNSFAQGTGKNHTTTIFTQLI